MILTFILLSSGDVLVNYAIQLLALHKGHLQLVSGVKKNIWCGKTCDTFNKICVKYSRFFLSLSLKQLVLFDFHCLISPVDIFKLVDLPSADQDPRVRYYFTEIYPKFTNLFIQMAGPKNIQHNSFPFAQEVDSTY